MRLKPRMSANRTVTSASRPSSSCGSRSSWAASCGVKNCSNCTRAAKAACSSLIRASPAAMPLASNSTSFASNALMSGAPPLCPPLRRSPYRAPITFPCPSRMGAATSADTSCRLRGVSAPIGGTCRNVRRSRRTRPSSVWLGAHACSLFGFSAASEWTASTRHRPSSPHRKHGRRVEPYDFDGRSRRLSGKSCALAAL